MHRLRLAACALLVLPSFPIAAQYQNHAQLTASLRQLASRAGTNTELVTIATSPGGRAVQALRIGAAGRPALLVIANAHGPHLVGSSIALAAAEQLRDANDSVTVWFIPRLNPDAAEGMFAAVPWARTANDVSWDDDRDQRNDEDGPDDLNGDRALVQLRLADPNGAWIADSADPRLLRRADVAKGEVGRWTVETEGRDDDGDGAYNEDGPGGTDVNRNFGYDYPHHGREAGRDPFATPEARGLAEFLMAHDEIAAVYVIGPQDNILRPWENRPNAGVMNPDTRERAQEGTSAGGPLNSILRADQATFADMGRRFQAVTGVTKAPPAAALGGDVLSWAYFHFGRWSFGSRGWWVPDAPRDTTQRAAGGTPRAGGSTGGSAGGGSDPLADDRNALRWFETQGIDAFVPWTSVTLGGTERRAAEVGGFRAGVLLNPPAGEQYDSTMARQSRFIATLAGLLPRLAIHDARAERLGDGVYRITVELANRGALPTTTSLAGRLRQPRRVRLDLDLGEATLLSGQKVQQLGAIEGGGRTTSVQWTVAARAGSTVRIAAGSPATGAVSQSITLR
jgi:hypothetical protein